MSHIDVTALDAACQTYAELLAEAIGEADAFASPTCMAAAIREYHKTLGRQSREAVKNYRIALRTLDRMRRHEVFDSVYDAAEDAVREAEEILLKLLGTEWVDND